MDRVYFRENVLVYYGNPAGYLLEGKVVLDVLFQKEELIQFLMKEHSVEVEAREGVYDSLVEGERAGKKDILTERRIRIHQLRSNAPILLRFVSLEERARRGYGQPWASEYEVVYEEETERFDLEAVWEKFRKGIPGYNGGHALSISDVVEFADGSVSRFFYVEPAGYQEIVF